SSSRSLPSKITSPIRDGSSGSSPSLARQLCPEPHRSAQASCRLDDCHAQIVLNRGIVTHDRHGNSQAAKQLSAGIENWRSGSVRAQSVRPGGHKAAKTMDRFELAREMRTVERT